MRRSNQLSVTTEPEEAAAAAELAAEAAAKVEAQEQAEAEVVITITISAVLTYKVMTAKSKADLVFTSMWLICGIFFAAVEIATLLAIGVASQWPHCLEQKDCRAGTVCVSYPEIRGFANPTCNDCHPDYLASGNVAVGILYGTDNQTATEFCLDTFNELDNAIKLIEFIELNGNAINFTSKSTQLTSFDRCLYIQETWTKGAWLDWVILQVVFLLVAMLSAEDQRQQQLICRLRRIILPLPLRPKTKTTGSILRWLGILLLTINEFIISLAAPMLPFGTVFLALTQGIDVSSTLLNGLQMGFVLQIDNLVPSIFFSPKVLAKVETYLLGEAVREMAKKDAGGFYGYITASPFIAVATVFMGLFAQAHSLLRSRSIGCHSLIYLLHSRATIFFGLWCTGALCFATEEGTRAIIGRQQRLRSPNSSRAIINEDAPPVPSARGAPKWAAPVLSMLVALTRRFVYLLTAAFPLNLVFYYLAVVLHYELEFKAGAGFYFIAFDPFGTCAQAYSNGTGNDCIPF